MRLPYRCDTPQCCACGTLVDDDHLFSFDGRPICDQCFPAQKRPLPSLVVSGEVAGYEPPLGRRALWLHALGVPGWLGLGAAAASSGLVTGMLVGLLPSFQASSRDQARALLAVALMLLPLSAALIAGAVRRAKASFAPLAGDRRSRGPATSADRLRPWGQTQPPSRFSLHGRGSKMARG